MKKLRYLCIFLLLHSFFANFVAWADPQISNGFFVEKRMLDFEKIVKRTKCTGQIPYPYLSHEDEELFMLLNHKIERFAEQYAICNKDAWDHYSVNFEIPESNDKDFFSILWKTSRYGKDWRIDTVTFNAENGEVLNPERIFHEHSNNLMHEIAKLSQGHLDLEVSWEEFLAKIESRDIQFYLKNDEWYIIFNSTPAYEQLVELQLPKYFLKHKINDDR